MRDRYQLNTGRPTDIFGKYVFPDDAEDIKAHHWFRGLPWESLQNIRPPFIPHITGVKDTRYFEESEPIEELSESSPEAIALTPEEVRTTLTDFRPSVQNVAIHLIATPYDSGDLRTKDREIDSMVIFTEDEKEVLKRFVRVCGQKRPKRPRDIMLRDDSIKDIVMDVRKQSAFMGYSWRRMRPGGYMAPKWGV